MNNRLQRYKLGSLIDVKRGQSISGKYYANVGEHIRLTLANFDYINGGFKVDSQKDDLYYTGPIKPECLLNEGDIITPLTEQALGLLGSTARIPESGKYIQSGDIALVTCKEGLLDPSFCYYLLPSRQVKKQLAAGSQQTKIRHTSPDAIKACVVDIPGYEQQKKIGKILSLIDKKILLNRSINANLEALVKQIYDYWFVQFDFPNEKNQPYKSSGGNMIWNDKIKREIPAGWEVLQMKDKCKCLLGGTPSREKDDYWGGDINWINSGKINEFRISTPSETITSDGLKNTSTYLMPKGTTVLAITGATLGQVSILNIDSCANQSVVGILENDDFPTEYIYELVLNDIPRLIYQQAGAAQPHVNKNDIESIPILLPNNDTIIRKYYEKTHNLFSQISNLETENVNLTMLRNKLLPLLMNGQVTIE